MENNKGCPNQPRKPNITQKLNFYISEFNNKQDNHPKKIQISWEGFLSRINQPAIRNDKDGKLFSGAIFNGKRAKENVIELSLLVLDCDDGTPLEEIKAKCKSLGYSYALYTTFSHTEKKPKFRVVFPLATPIAANIYPLLWKWISKEFPNIDRSAKDSSRIFYYPAIKSQDAPFYTEAFNEGKLLDWRELKDLASLTGEPPKQQHQQPSYNQTSGNKAKSAYVQAAIDGEISKIKNTVEGERNNTLNSAAFALAQLLRTGLIDESTIKSSLEGAALSVGLSRDEARRTIESGIAAGRKQPRTIPEKEFSFNYYRSNEQQTVPKKEKEQDKSAYIDKQTQLPVIRTDIQLSETFDRTREAFTKANNPVKFFRRNGKVVCINYDDSGIKLEIANADIIYSQLARIATWVKVGIRGKPKNCKPPREATNDLLANVDNRLPEIEAVITTPIFIDGELISAPGYHPKHKIYYHPPEGFELLPVSQNPTQKEIQEARKLLVDEVLGDFPFCSDSSPNGQAELANAIAAILLPFVRRQIKGHTPLHLIEAPVQGSGKSLLASIIGIITTGKEPAMRSFPGQEEEVRKIITSELLRGGQIIIFDNITGKLKSDALASALTSDEWADRLLGLNQNVSLKNRVLWLATGNNCTLGQDFPRRTIRIRLNPQVEKPWLRTRFKHEDIVNWVKGYRPRIIHAILTLIQAWVAEGQILGSKSLGGFEKWARVISGILEIAGISGFLENIDEVYKTFESQNENWSEFTEIWYDNFGTTPKRPNELNQLCQELNLMTAIRGDKVASQTTKLGMALSKNRGRIFGKYQIINTSVTSNGSGRNAYALRVIDENDQLHTADLLENCQGSPRFSPEAVLIPGDFYNCQVKSCDTRQGRQSSIISTCDKSFSEQQKENLNNKSESNPGNSGEVRQPQEKKEDNIARVEGSRPAITLAAPGEVENSTSEKPKLKDYAQRALACAEWLELNSKLVARVAVTPGEMITDPLHHSRFLQRQFAQGVTLPSLIKELNAIEIAVKNVIRN